MTTLHALSGPEAAIDVLRSHYASLTDRDEITLEQRLVDQQIDTDNPWDFADFALRTCACGQSIDGFYEYTDHLISVLREGNKPTLFKPGTTQ